MLKRAVDIFFFPSFLLCSFFQTPWQAVACLLRRAAPNRSRAQGRVSNTSPTDSDLVVDDNYRDRDEGVFAGTQYEDGSPGDFFRAGHFSTWSSCSQVKNVCRLKIWSGNGIRFLKDNE